MSLTSNAATVTPPIRLIIRIPARVRRAHPQISVQKSMQVVDKPVARPNTRASKRKAATEDLEASPAPSKRSKVVHAPSRRKTRSTTEPKIIRGPREEYSTELLEAAAAIASEGQYDASVKRFQCICGRDLEYDPTKGRRKDWLRHLRVSSHWTPLGLKRPALFCDPWECDTCGKVFERKDLWKRHRERKVFPCNISNAPAKAGQSVVLPDTPPSPPPSLPTAVETVSEEPISSAGTDFDFSGAGEFPAVTPLDTHTAQAGEEHSAQAGEGIVLPDTTVSPLLFPSPVAPIVAQEGFSPSTGLDFDFLLDTVPPLAPYQPAAPEPISEEPRSPVGFDFGVIDTSPVVEPAATDLAQTGLSVIFPDAPPPLAFSPPTVSETIFEDPLSLTDFDLGATDISTDPEPVALETGSGDQRLNASLELFTQLASNAVPGSQLWNFFDDVFAELSFVQEHHGEGAMVQAFLRIVDANLIPNDTEFFCLSQDPSEEIAMYDAIATECSLPAGESTVSEQTR